MFLLDDLLLSPVKGIISICKKVDEAAHQDLENQQKNAIAALGELHRRLEAGQITEADFDVEESKLLEKIDQITLTLRGRVDEHA